MRHGGHIQVFSAECFEKMAADCGLPVIRRRWTYHGLLQALDLTYFSWLDIRAPVTGSVDDMAVGRGGAVGAFMEAGAMSVSTLAWSEARLLRVLPGGCGHFTCACAPDGS